MWPSRTLASQVLLGVLGILLVTTTVGGFMYVSLSNRQLDQQYERRALGVADTVAQMPDIGAALLSGDRAAGVEDRTGRLRFGAGAEGLAAAGAGGEGVRHPGRRDRRRRQGSGGPHQHRGAAPAAPAAQGQRHAPGPTGAARPGARHA